MYFILFVYEENAFGVQELLFSFERKHIKKEVAVNIAYGWSCAVFPGCRLYVRCFTYKIHRIGAYVLLPFPAFLIFITQYTSTVSL